MRGYSKEAVSVELGGEIVSIKRESLPTPSTPIITHTHTHTNTSWHLNFLSHEPSLPLTPDLPLLLLLFSLSLSRTHTHTHTLSLSLSLTLSLTLTSPSHHMLLVFHVSCALGLAVAGLTHVWGGKGKRQRIEKSLANQGKFCPCGNTRFGELAMFSSDCLCP